MIQLKNPIEIKYRIYLDKPCLNKAIVHFAYIDERSSHLCYVTLNGTIIWADSIVEIID